MSIEAITIVLHHSAAKGTDKLILWGIANHQGDGGAWPSLDTLAKYAGVSNRTASRAISNLIDLGEISSDRNGAPVRSNNRPNLYWVTLMCPADCDGSMNHRTEGGHVRRGRHDTYDVAGTTPVSSEPLREPTKKPDTRATLLKDADFMVSEEMKKWAATNHPGVEIEIATLNFTDYWLSKPTNNKKLDWVRTWQTWIRNTKPVGKVSREEQNRINLKGYGNE